MVKLTDLQLASLLEEIGCAMRAGTPIADSMRRLESRRLGRVGRAAQTIASGLERGQSLADSVEGINSATHEQAAAAIRACAGSRTDESIARLPGESVSVVDLQ